MRVVNKQNFEIFIFNENSHPEKKRKLLSSHFIKKKWACLIFCLKDGASYCPGAVIHKDLKTHNLYTKVVKGVHMNPTFSFCAWGRYSKHVLSFKSKPSDSFSSCFPAKIKLLSV